MTDTTKQAEPFACIHCGGKGYWKSGVSSETFVCLCQITDTDAVFDKCPKYPTAPVNTLDADTTTRMRLVLDLLGVENSHFEDLPPYLFSLLGMARRNIEVLHDEVSEALIVGESYIQTRCGQDKDAKKQIQSVLNKIKLRKNRKGKPSSEDTHPAPALTAELKAELLDALRIGFSNSRELSVIHKRKADIIIYESDKDRIQSAITKLTNLGEAK